MKKILITGGHLTPAIAVADEIVHRQVGEVIWVGTAKTSRQDTNFSSEYKVVQDRNYRFVNLQTGKLFRKWNSYTYKDAFYNLYLIPVGFINAFKILIKEKPDLVMSFGGYLGVPLAIWAWLIRIPVLTHEQTVVSGLANKVISLFSKKVLISWEVNLEHYKKNKAILTGNPMPKMYYDVYEEEERNYFDNGLKTIFITGGNQGSHRINETIKPILESLLNKYNVIHQCGGTSQFKDLSELNETYQRIKDNVKGKYLLYDYDMSVEHARHYKFSDLVISRSGANSMSNLLLYSKGCILIPIPWSSKQEQMKNALILEQAGLGTIIQQDNLSPELLLSKISSCFSTNANTNKASQEVNLVLHAEKRIVDVIIPYL